MALLRIGSITLPSSMDLRQYLEQMQEVGEEFDPEPEDGPVADAADAAPSGAPAAAATAAVLPDANMLTQAAGPPTRWPVLATCMSRMVACGCHQPNRYCLDAFPCCVKFGVLLSSRLFSSLY